MVTHVSSNVLKKAKSLHKNRETLQAWKLLADFGDTYAAASYFIGSNQPGFFTSFRQAHWRLATGKSMSDPLWHEAAHTSLGHYLEVLENSESEFLGEKHYKLPTTAQIEQCHILSVEKHGLPKEAVIHLVSNNVTGLINKTFEPLLNPLFKLFNSKADGPDWHEVLATSHGSMGKRGIDNSPNQTDTGFTRNLSLLAQASGLGVLDYVRTHYFPK